MSDRIELEREDDGRWIAEISTLAGCLAYGDSLEAALSAVPAIALRVLADRIEHGEAGPGPVTIVFETAAAAGADGPRVARHASSPHESRTAWG